MTDALETAPPWQVSQWFNTDAPVQLAALRGRVVVVHAFQMLCPACVSHGLPQAVRMHEAYPQDQVAVIGLHTVFEHHAVMGPDALRVFIHENRLSFPIGIDQAAASGRIPLTMQAYSLSGTPSLLLIDRQGRLRLNHFGHLDDLRVGTLVGQLLAEAAVREESALAASPLHTPM
jgi:hypothetical protein